jgi:hypothetical protein
LANAQVFDPTLDSFVREVLQNSRDQRIDGNRVDVRFTLTEISGPELSTLLEAIGWAQLREHIAATAIPELVTIGPRLQEGLDLVGRGAMRILRIQDTGTRGLVGGEDDAANFGALVRHELITSGDRRESGGSFGLGKGVLWRFSDLSTVLFHSVLSEPQRSRFIGRTVLAGHETNGSRWEGSGWFGIPDPEQPLRAISVWDEPAREMAALTRLDRPHAATGVSILVLGFDDPSREVEPSVAETCEQIATSATRWFWPALYRDDLSVLVEGFEGDENVFTAHAQPATPEVAPFVHAEHDAPTADNTVAEPGDVAARPVTIAIPGTKPDRFESPHDRMEVSATLRFRLAESGETEHLNTVALQRGTGMVVQYRPLRVRSGGDQSFHAVLLAGLAHGESAADRALEAFLRAAEPPAHTDWTPTTERIRAEYRQGHKKALDDLFAAIDAAVRDLAAEEVVDSDEGPDALTRLFPLPGVGEPMHVETYRLTQTGAKLHGDRWDFGGSFRRTPADETDASRDWEVSIVLAVDQEGTGTPSRIPIDEFAVDGPATPDPVRPDGAVTVRVPAYVQEIRFNGTTAPVLELPAGGLRRVRLRMDVKGASGRDGHN